MKKIIAIVLVASMLVGCSGGSVGNEIGEVQNELEQVENREEELEEEIAILRGREDELEDEVNSLKEREDELVKEIELLEDNLNASGDIEYLNYIGDGVYFGGEVYDGKIVVAKDGEHIVLDKEFPTRPVQWGDNIAFISPYEFELIGNVYIVNTETLEEIQVTDYAYEDQLTAKEVAWLDNENLLIISGFSHGTITKGGDVYKYNIVSGELDLVVESGDYDVEEFTDIKIENNKVFLEGVYWTDDNYMEYEYKFIVIDGKEFLD